MYIAEQVLEILTVAALRRKGLSLQRIRKVLRLLRRELGQQRSSLLAGKSTVYLITDGNSVGVDDQPDGVLNRIAEANGHRADPLSLAHQVDEHPAAVVLLDVPQSSAASSLRRRVCGFQVDAQRGYFGSRANATTE